MLKRGSGGGADEHIADTSDAHDASAVSVLDAGLLYTATNVETALAEVKTIADASTAHIADAADAHDASAISVLDDGEYFTATHVEGALAEAGSDLGNIRGYRQITFTIPAAEVDQAIVVTGTVSDLVGNSIAYSVPVFCRSLAITADKGDMTVVTGTLRKAYSPAAGVNELWLDTESDGTFSVSVANDQAEITLFMATPQLGMGDMVTLTFT